MKCKRCLSDTESYFRVYTDELNIMVCVSCVAEARRIGLPVEALGRKVVSLPDSSDEGRYQRERWTETFDFFD
jgi:hypothetical protein